jgi:hypothetical protein
MKAGHPMGSFALSNIEVDPAAALALFGEGLEIYRAFGDIDGEGQALLGQATAQFAQGRLTETRESLERSLELHAWPETGTSRSSRASSSAASSC